MQLFSLLILILSDDTEALKRLAIVENTAAVEVQETHPVPVPETPAAVPTITFEAVASAQQLLRSTAATKERWLVSEPWCSLCPAAKRRFLQSGGDESHIISIADAQKLHGKTITGVPREYTTESTIEIIQPPHYRKQWPMQTSLNGSHTPSKSALLRHLRDDGPHQGKHWYRWNIESWSKEQLAALHDDDHADSVPTFEAESDVVATIENATLSPSVIAAALAEHLTRDSPDAALASSPFDITIDAPDSARGWIADLLSRKQIEFSSGVSVAWGGDRQISIGEARIGIKPGAKVTARKFGISVSASLTGISYVPDLSSVTLELDGAPDLIVRFK